MAQVDRCKVPQAFWRAVEHIGVPPVALLRQARLPATLHLGGQAFVTTAQYFALMRGLEELSGDPALGLRMVREVDTAVHPPSSLAAFYARDYRDGLARLARFKRLCMPEQLQIVEAGGNCTISVDWPFATEAEPAISVDITFASLVELGRRATGKAIMPRRVEFARPGPASTAHADYFGCLIRTGTHDLLVLDAADLDRPFPGHNPEMLEMLTPALSAALGELEAQSSVAEQVKIVLKRCLASGQPGLSDIARQLGMSDRTLQRRITEEGSTFRGLLAEARRDLGRRLLTDPATDIDEVACLLGYHDTTSFYRAFREWEGMPPNRWREMHLPKGAAVIGLY
ncbi:AraC family transcriptional regulator [Beijerinckia indica]|uniref:Transcriptional regulator, AraC family n=1 Tax=Beijerinckia indica subsp. indica (strain ATCC 9039 / DSM 1715 / NCIMB 8712) TaxID=395963 RepID=B2IAY9_BEII9|nr:AraC family transcriptional regulator [Beijerinckia indica]ACB93689.1 transcriptional regulator, AraC family [Beijerinckia indica subsp. indica ATCC 9039]